MRAALDENSRGEHFVRRQDEAFFNCRIQEVWERRIVPNQVGWDGGKEISLQNYKVDIVRRFLGTLTTFDNFPSSNFTFAASMLAGNFRLSNCTQAERCEEARNDVCLARASYCRRAIFQI